MTDEELKRHKKNFNMAAIMTPFLVGGGAVVFNYGLSHILTGIGDLGSLAIAGLGGWMALGSITACIKDARKYFSAKKEYAEEHKNEISETNISKVEDISNSKNKQKDSRFQGQENPPKIERQSLGNSHQRDDVDSREP